MKVLRRTRRKLYRTASVLGDIDAVASGKPDRILRRFLRKLVWRNFGRAMRRTGL